MTSRARRGNSGDSKPLGDESADEGAERYMWAFPNGDEVVLSIPGVRDLKLSKSDALDIAKMLIGSADEVERKIRHRQAAKNNIDKEG